MSKTYDPSLGADRDWVRVLVGDNSSPMTLTDEEIDGIVSEQSASGKSRKYFAAADALHILYGLYKAGRRGVVDRQISKLRLRFGEDVSAANAVAKEADALRRKGAFYQSRTAGKSYSFRMV